MIDHGKRNVLGVLVDAVDYRGAVDRVMAAARAGRGYAAAALAVHGLMTGVRDAGYRYRLNHLDLVTPDGQPVRWAMNLLHGTRLPDRVYGPSLMRHLCRAAAAERLPLFLYGSSPKVLERLIHRLGELAPGVIVAGAEPSRFRPITLSEKQEIAAQIRTSGARLTFVGLGCPRQEVFVHEFREELRMPVLAVGAAFDYLAGERQEPPSLVQRAGLQWMHRLMQEPARLWRRYAVLNPAFIALLALQFLGFWEPDPTNVARPSGDVSWG